MADGAWEVRIPTRRTNVGRVTAYAWFEVETKTGRLVGRTEDGLHGSLADPETWPDLNPDDLDPSQWNPHASDAFGAAATQQPFTMWFQGITAYTMGSVQGAFDWRNSPGFRIRRPGGVQAVRAGERARPRGRVVGRHRFGRPAGSSPRTSGRGSASTSPCSPARWGSGPTGAPGSGRRTCAIAARKAVQSAGEDIPAEAATDLLEKEFGEEHTELITWAAEQGFSDLAEDLKDAVEGRREAGHPLREVAGAAAEVTARTGRCPREPRRNEPKARRTKATLPGAAGAGGSPTVDPVRCKRSPLQSVRTGRYHPGMLAPSSPPGALAARRVTREPGRGVAALDRDAPLRLTRELHRGVAERFRGGPCVHPAPGRKP